MARWVVAALLLYPVAEIATFVLVSRLTGVALAFALLIGTSMIGILVLRRASRGELAGFRVALGERNIRAINVDGHGFLTVIGGILLVLPGFISDLIGLLLLIAPLRRWGAEAIRRFLRRGRDDNAVVDLDPEEWHRVPDRELDDHRRPRAPD